MTNYHIRRNVDLQFNAQKCHCMVIGKMYKSNIASMYQDLIHWCNNIRYLGVYIVSDKSDK